MNKQNRSLTLALLLSINQCYYINSGIGDIFDGIKNGIEFVEDIGLELGALSIESTEALSRKTGLNFNTLRQVATSLAFPAYMLHPDVYDQAIKQMSASGILDEEREMILELIHQMGNIQNAAMYSPKQMADESLRLNKDLYKLGKLFREKIKHGRSSKLSGVQNSHLMSLIENSKEQAKQMQSQEEFECKDLWIGAALAMVLIGICLCILFIWIKRGGEEAEVLTKNVTEFKKNNINSSIFQNEDLWFRMDRNLSTASIDTLV